MDENQETNKARENAPEVSDQDPDKSLDDVKQEVLGILSEKVLDQLRKTQHEDVAFLNQTYGDVADLVVTASVGRELVEAIYGRDVATRLWDPDQTSGPENGDKD